MSAITLFARRVSLALCLPLLFACVPMTNNGALICDTEDGDGADVHEVYGTWTLQTGYSDGARSDEELEHDYDVLVVETGGGICRVSYLSKEPVETVMLGSYSHDVPTDRLDITLTIPRSVTISAKYSFGGSCGNPTMTLRYNNSSKSTETYKFRGKDTGDGCPD